MTSKRGKTVGYGQMLAASIVALLAAIVFIVTQVFTVIDFRNREITNGVISESTYIQHGTRYSIEDRTGGVIEMIGGGANGLPSGLPVGTRIDKRSGALSYTLNGRVRRMAPVNPLLAIAVVFFLGWFVAGIRTVRPKPGHARAKKP
jgi:hypothetical protein